VLDPPGLFVMPVASWLSLSGIWLVKVCVFTKPMKGNSILGNYLGICDIAL
jgi:hypothetical protein